MDPAAMSADLFRVVLSNDCTFTPSLLATQVQIACKTEEMLKSINGNILKHMSLVIPAVRMSFG